MEYLNALDAAFLEIEDADPRVSLSIGSVTVLDGPAPDHTELLDVLGARLANAPRFAQRVRRTPLDLSRPAWVDDPEFDVNYHVRRTALPAPGDDAALGRLVSRVMAQRLDRDRPLWECWIVEGLADGRWAVLTKVHHCLADGVSGRHLYDILTDPAEAPRHTKHPGLRQRREPHPTSLLDTLAGVATLPLRVLRTAISVASGVQRLLADLLTPAAATSLAGPLGRARRYGVARASLNDVREVGAAFDATVNDVALAAITRAFRALLLSRGEDPAPDAVRTLVPVSTRAAGDEDVLDNRVSLLTAYLPVDVDDPVRRLTALGTRLRTMKSSHESEAGESVVALGGHVPSAPVSWLVRLVARLPQHSIITLTTNVAGPEKPLHVLGRRIVEIWPIVPIALQLRIGIAILTYHDRMVFGVTTDYRSVPEVALFCAEIERGVAELVRAARERHRTATTR